MFHYVRVLGLRWVWVRAIGLPLRKTKLPAPVMRQRVFFQGLHVFRPAERLLIKWGSGSKNCSHVNAQTETPNFENVCSPVHRKATAW